MRPNDEARPLRVCLAVPYIAPFYPKSGVAWYNRWLAEGLVRKGHSVKVIDASLLGPPAVPEPWGNTIVVPRPKHAVLPKSIRTALFVRKALASDKTLDVFETSNWPGLAGLRPREMATTFIRLVTPLDGGMDHWRQAVCNALDVNSVRHADAVIASTSYIERKLSSQYKLDLSHAYRVPFGIPDVDVPKAANREGPLRFVKIGRADARKGGDILLKALLMAFESRDDFNVTLVGSHAPFAQTSVELSEIWTVLTTKFSRRLTNLESISEEDKLMLLSSSDYLIMPSRHESFGLPVIEAMRAGTAVISTDGGGLREVAGSSTGNILYEDVENPEVLAGALISAVQRGRTDAIERGCAARRTYLERFHEDVFIDGTIDAYRDGIERTHFKRRSN